MGIPRVIECDPRHQCRVEIRKIGELLLVERQICAAANFPLEIGSHGSDHIKPASARQHPRFERLVGVEIRDVDLNARQLFEGRDGVGRQEIRPDEEIENF